MTNELTELLSLLQDDIYTDAVEYAGRVCRVQELAQCIREGKPAPPLQACDECGTETYEFVGCPDGAEICRDCFEEGKH